MLSATQDADVRLFFALLPPPAVAARIFELGQQLQRAHRLTGTAMPAGRLHCSLHRIDLSKRPLETAVAKAQDAAARLRVEPFDVVFDKTISFRGREAHPFVLCGGRGLGSLTVFYRTLGNALFQTELRDGPSNTITPHVTMIYGGDRLIDAHPIPPIHWRVETFELIASTRGKGHAQVGSWRLRG